MKPAVPPRFHVSGALGAASLVSLVAAVIIACARSWNAATLAGAFGATVSAAATVTYVSQLTFPAWWSASLEIPPGDEDKVAALFRGAAIRSAALSLVATAVCGTVCALGLRFRSG